MSQVVSLCPSDPDLAAVRGLGDEAVHWSHQLDSRAQDWVETLWVLVISYKRSYNRLSNWVWVLVISYKRSYNRLSN